jgi:hypothetical protein
MHAGKSADLIDSALVTAAYATQTALHLSTKISPGGLVFNRDMLLDIPIIADLHLLQEKRQEIINKNLEWANKKKVAHEYHPGEQVMRLVYKPDKLEPRAEGPYVIDEVFANGTISIHLNDMITQRINIRQVKPYRTAAAHAVISVFDLWSSEDVFHREYELFTSYFRGCFTHCCLWSKLLPPFPNNCPKFFDHG